ncbi:MAG: YlbF family regulator [Phycisphaerae bacterium]
MSNENIIDLAGRLGEAIAASPQAQALREARDDLNDNEGTKKLLGTAQEHMNRLATMEQEGKPIEVEDKQRMQQLQDQLVSDETFKKFNAAQVEYVDLMRKVNATMREKLAPVEEGE